MPRHQITRVRANIKTIAAAIAGLTAVRIHVGAVDVDIDDNVFLGLNSQVPIAIDIAGTTAVATFDDAPVFTAGQIVTIDCVELEELSDDYVGAHTVMAVDAVEKTISWTIPAAGAPASIEPAAGDLIFTTPKLVISPAENSKTDGDNGIADSNVEVLFLFGLAADTDQDFLAIESLVYQLRDALADQSKWDSVCIGITNCKIPRPKMLSKQKPFAGVYTLTLEFTGV